MKYLVFTLCVAITLLKIDSTQAQVDNSGFINIERLDEQDSNKLILNLNALAFTKNNEYFNDIADGYTLFGYQFSPTLKYQPLKNLSLEGGVFLHKDFGDEGIREIQPLFRFTYERDDLQLIFGNLNGNLNHRLIEPLYDFENVLFNPIENGLQFRYWKESWWADLWIDWQKMIYEGDPEQEQVLGGLSFEKTLFERAGWKVMLPFQATVFHLGGQIDINPNPLVISWNSAIGSRIVKESKGFIKEWEGSFYYTYFKDFSSEIDFIFEDGEGLMINGSFTTSFDLETMLTYWQGNEYISSIGGQLYPSVSSKFDTPGYFEEERELLILRFTHNIHLFQNIYLISRFEPYYDLGNQTFEFSHGLYISYRQPITLVKEVRK